MEIDMIILFQKDSFSYVLLDMLKAVLRIFPKKVWTRKPKPCTEYAKKFTKLTTNLSNVQLNTLPRGKNVSSKNFLRHIERAFDIPSKGFLLNSRKRYANLVKFQTKVS